ncbi:MAG: protein kinase [Deltaproteobacteria bacterium]|nr:protein kinase [Deltaproteobacteria bacterium]
MRTVTGGDLYDAIVRLSTGSDRIVSSKQVREEWRRLGLNAGERRDNPDASWNGTQFQEADNTECNAGRLLKWKRTGGIGWSLPPNRPDDRAPLLECASRGGWTLTRGDLPLPPAGESAATSPLDAGQRVGNYTVDSELGAGGMARVYRVHHTTLGTSHALKVLEPQYRVMPELRARFLAEARIQAGLLHDNVVRVTDTVSTPDIAGFVMELIDGPTLEQHLASIHRPMTNAELRSVFLPILDALGEAHEKGIIHRDIKPANILLAQTKRGTIPKLADFGIAKIADPTTSSARKASTHTNARMGTVGYMSPEQIQQAKSVTARSDIFSLGATLYEAATGAAAFEGHSDFEVMRNIVDGRVVAPIQRAAHLDQSIAACIERSLAPDPAARFASCSEFAMALARQERSAFTHPSLPGPAAPPESARHPGQWPALQPADSGAMTRTDLPRHTPDAAPVVATVRPSRPRIGPARQPRRRRTWPYGLAALFVAAGTGIALYTYNASEESSSESRSAPGAPSSSPESSGSGPAASASPPPIQPTVGNSPGARSRTSGPPPSVQPRTPRLSRRDAERHELFQAAAASGDVALMTRVNQHIGIADNQGVPNDSMEAFMNEHTDWAMSNAKWIMNYATDPAKASAFVRGHMPVSNTSLTFDEAHRLFQAAAASGDVSVMTKVNQRVGIADANGVPNDSMEAFMNDHTDWAMRNAQWIVDNATSPARAKSWLRAHP